MMLKQTSEKFRLNFLLKFTEQLVRNSKNAEASSIEIQLREKIKENIEKKQREKQLSDIVKKRIAFFPQQNLSKPIRFRQRIQNQKIIIPRQRIPQTIQNIRPIPTILNLDLKKLNPLVKDPTVKAIQCVGAEKNILAIRGKEIRKTPIILSKQEVQETIEKFSQEAQIPIQEGTFKVAVGNLVLSAIISDIVDSKFIVEKIGF